jgi:hypothetical protein
MAAFALAFGRGPRPTDVVRARVALAKGSKSRCGLTGEEAGRRGSLAGTGMAARKATYAGGADDR